MYICKDTTGFRVWGLGNRATWLLGGHVLETDLVGAKCTSKCEILRDDMKPGG